MKLKKKERTNEQKVRRGKIALIIVAIIAVIAFLFPTKKTEKQNDNPNAIVQQKMDDCLDSLLTDLMGSQTYNVFYKGDIENVPFIQECQEEQQLERVNLQIKLLENEKIPNPNRKEELENLYNDRSYLERKVEEFKEGPVSKAGYNSRRIKFRTEDGKSFTCFQQNFMGVNRLKHLQELTKDSNPQSELKKLQQDLSDDSDIDSIKNE